MSLSDFLLGTDSVAESRYDDGNRKKGTKVPSQVPNISEMAEAFFYAKDAETVEEFREKLEEYYELLNIQVVEVYVYGPGPKDFFPNEADAEKMAHSRGKNFKVYATYARVSNGELVLLTTEQLEKYLKKKNNTRKG